MSQIGSHTFINISGVPTAPQQNIVLESQAGVQGVTAWLTGLVGQKSSFQTVRDCTSLGDALSILAQYQALPGLGPQQIRFGQATLPFYIKVLDVQPVEVKQLVAGVGGVLGTSAAILRAKWTVTSWVT